MARRRSSPLNHGMPLAFTHTTAAACLVLSRLPPLVMPKYVFGDNAGTYVPDWPRVLGDPWFAFVAVFYVAWAIHAWRRRVTADTGCGVVLACYGLYARQFGLPFSWHGDYTLLIAGSVSCVLGVVMAITVGVQDEIHRRRARPQADVSAFE